MTTDFPTASAGTSQAPSAAVEKSHSASHTEIRTLPHQMPRKPIAEFNLNAFSGPFRAESDRACAVLGAALLDSRLENLFQRRLRSSRDELLSSTGPIGAFSARIKLARSLEWISSEVYDDLTQIRSIRNVFAHDADHELSFANQSIADKCHNLRVAQTLIDAHEHTASSGTANLAPDLIRTMGRLFKPPRQRFEITVEMLAQHLDELPGEAVEYAGPDLRKELWILGSTFEFKFSISLEVSHPPPTKESAPRE